MNQTISEQFARKLDLWFSSQHGKQKEVAEALGLKPSRLNSFVKGKRKTSEDIRLAICREIGVDYEQFLTGKIAKEEPVDPELDLFLDLYRQYGHPALLRQVIDKLMEIKRIIEGS